MSKTTRTCRFIFGVTALTAVMSTAAICAPPPNPIDVSAGEAAIADNGTITLYPEWNDYGRLVLVTNSGVVVSTDDLVPAVRASIGYTLDNSGAIIAIGAGADAVVMGDQSTVVNNPAGLIISQYGNGVVTGSASSITNSGIVDAALDGIQAGDDNTIINNGLLISRSGVGISAGDGNAITNNEIIDAAVNGIQAGDDNTIINNGLLISRSGVGISAGDGNTISNNEIIDVATVGILTGEDSLVTNTGTIYADRIGVFAGNGSTVLNAYPEISDANIAPMGEAVGNIDAPVGILVQYDQEMVGSIVSAAEEGDYESILLTAGGLLTSAPDSELSATVTNDGYIAADIAGVMAQGNATITNNGTIAGRSAEESLFGEYGLAAGIVSLDGNTVENNGSIDAMVGVGVRDNNDIINNGYISTGAVGVLAHAGNTIINGEDAFIGGYTESFGGNTSIVGIAAFDNNTIINNGTIEAGYAGIVVSAVSPLQLVDDMMSQVIGEDEQPLSDGTYLDDYVPQGNYIENNGTILTQVSEYYDGMSWQLDANGWGIMVMDEELLLAASEEGSTSAYAPFISEEEVGTKFFNTIVNNGYIGGYPDAIVPVQMLGYPGGNGIYAGSYSDVTNNGVINAFYTGIAGVDGNLITNNGEIYSDQGGLLNNTGIHVNDQNTVINNGLIYSEGATAVIVGDNNTVTNNEEGVIVASYYNPGNGIDAQDNNTITNYGTIEAVYNAGIMMAEVTDVVSHSHGIHAVSGNDITNYGVITAGTAGIEGFGDDNDILNADGALIRAYEVGISAGNSADVENQPIGNRVINEGQIGVAPEIVITSDGSAYDYPVVTGILVNNKATVVNGCVDGDCTGTIHAAYAGIATGGNGDTIDNYGAIYVYGGAVPNPSVGNSMSYGDAGISVGSGNLVMIGSLEEDTTIGAGDVAAIEEGIVNTISNYGLIDTYDEVNETGAAGIRTYDFNRITNAEGAIIDAYYDGIIAGNSNIIRNDGEIYSDRQVSNCGIDAGDYNLITNSGSITSYASTGIETGSHNEITNSGTIDAYADGIMTGSYSKITNTVDGVITAGEDGIASYGENVYIVNDGTITGYNGINLCYEDFGTYGDDTLENSGTITATGGTAVMMGAGNDTVILKDGSLIDGGLLTGMGNDVVISNGDVTINGEFKLGEDDDTLTVESGTLHVDYESTSYFGDGNDTLNVYKGATFQFAYNSNLFSGGDDTINIWGAATNDLRSAIGNDTFNIYDGAILRKVEDESPVELCGGDDTDTLNFFGGVDGAITVSAFEQITKEGDGLVQLVGDSWGNGIFDLKAGTVQVDGDLTVEELYVYNGATLAGNGTVNASYYDTVYNAGNISPGAANAETLQDRIGTLTINGSFVNYMCQEEGGCTSGNLNIELYDAPVVVPEGMVPLETAQLNDVIQVWSPTTAVFGGEGIDGGKVTAIPLNYLRDGRYTFLYADNLEVNEAPVVNDTALLDFTLGYDAEAVDGPDSMWLDVERKTLEEIGGNGNDQTIFDILNELAEEGNGDAQEAIAALVQEGESGGVLRGLGELSPEQYPSLLDVGMAGADLYRTGLLSRLGNLHLTRGPQDIMVAGNSNSMASGNPALTRQPAFQRTEGGLSAWARVLGMKGSQDSDNGRLGFDVDGYGVAMGIDNQISKNFVLGVGGGYTSSDVDFDSYGQNTDVEGFHGALYGSYSTQSFYVDTAVQYAGSNYETDRMTPGGKVTSDTDGSEVAVYVGGGYNLVDTASWYLIPTVAAQWARIDIDGFTERGASPYTLKVGDFDADSITTKLGFRVGTTMDMGTARIAPEMRLSWGHEFGDTDRNVSASFNSLGSPSFTVSGVKPERDSALFGLGVNAVMSKELTLFVDYDGEFRSDFNGHSLSGGLRWYF